MSLTSRILLLDVTENGPCGLVAESGMSALGQKPTFAAHKPMSALSPKADIDAVSAKGAFDQMMWTNQGHFAGFISYSILSKDRS